MLEEHRSQPFLLLSMLIILVQKNASAGLWHINLLIWLYPTLPAITSTLPHDPLAVFEWVIKKLHQCMWIPKPIPILNLSKPILSFQYTYPLLKLYYMQTFVW